MDANQTLDTVAINCLRLAMLHACAEEHLTLIVQRDHLLRALNQKLYDRSPKPRVRG